MREAAETEYDMLTLRSRKYLYLDPDVLAYVCADICAMARRMRNRYGETSLSPVAFAAKWGGGHAV
jgi:hypothetical protein